MSTNTDKKFTEYYYKIPKTSENPNGRVLSVWKNATGGRFYKDGVEIAGALTQARKDKDQDAINLYHRIYMGMRAEEKRLNGPRFPFN